MAVAHDGEANVTNFQNGTTVTCANKTSAGSERYGIAAIISASDNITGVTWGGAAMDFISKRVDATQGRTAHLYGLEGIPTTGSSVVATASASSNLIMICSSYNGVDQATSVGTPAGANGTTSPATVTVTDTADGFVVDALWFLGAGTAPAVEADQTENGRTDDGTYFGASSRQPGTADGVMSWTLTSPTRWVITAAPLLAVAAAGGSILRQMMNYHGG